DLAMEALTLLGIDAEPSSLGTGVGLGSLAEHFAARKSESVPILAGSPAGIDLTNISPAVLETLGWADLWVLKDEGSLQGVAPEYRFRKDILHLFIARNPLLFGGISQFMNKQNDPSIGDAVAWFRPAA
ncbi:MAG TPA: hypothetical protein VMT55_03045, partial [Candidatus Sulfotelmatobacter sp.]|nr:hypothetical protein [Candidatus Sulfotelmatobacter sp.]